MKEPSTLLLILTGLILVIRGPYALQSKASRPGWLAGVCGLLAVICLGFVIPIPVLDAALGSAGYWNILGSTLTTLSFHFMYQAILIHTSRDIPRLYYLGLLLALIFSTTAFALIEGQEASFLSVEGFIATLIGQLSTVAYLSFYLATVAVISVLSLDAVWRTPPRSKVFTAGFSLVVLGNVVDIVLLWLQHTQIVSAEIPALLYKIYVVLFFAGVIALCGGFLRGSFTSLIRYHRFLYYSLRVRKIIARTGARVPEKMAILLDPKSSCYQGMILVRDFVTLSGFVLTDAELRLTHKVDQLLIEAPLAVSS